MINLSSLKSSTMVILYLVGIFISGNIFFPARGLASSEEHLPKIGIMEFRNSSSVSDLGDVAVESVTADLLKMNTCEVIERRRLHDLLKEQSFDLSGAVDSNSAAQMGKILGLDYLLMGSVSGETTTHPGYYVTDKNGKSYWNNAWNTSSVGLSLSLVSVETGKIVWSNKNSSSGVELGDALSPAVYNVMRDFYTFMPAQGYVVKVEGNKFWIDLGSQENVTVKDRISVTREGEAIIHPITGKVIKQIKTIAVLEVTEVMDNLAIATRIEGDMPTVGDKATRQLRDKPGQFLGLFGSKDHLY